jgi:Asp-tRNA(Asn)/Glu-tRNA(Gln) amidotransferase C subunit
MNQEEIKKDAKRIMDSFMQSIEQFDVEEEFELHRNQCLREEKEGKTADEEFKRIFLKNAPKTSGDSIVANKAAWEE